jgi:hypothetical protein
MDYRHRSDVSNWYFTHLSCTSLSTRCADWLVVRGIDALGIVTIRKTCPELVKTVSDKHSTFGGFPVFLAGNSPCYIRST